MTTQMEEDQIRDGQSAYRILESDLWKRAEAEVREWTHSKLIQHWSDPDALREISAFALAHDKYTSFLQELVENGQYVFAMLESEKESEE